MIQQRQYQRTLHLNAGSVGDKSEVLKQPCLDLVEIVDCVLVGHVCRTDMQLEVGAKVLKVVIVREF